MGGEKAVDNGTDMLYICNLYSALFSFFLLAILFFSDIPRGGIVMLSIYGTYDGKVVRPLVKVNLPPNVRAIITFLSDEGINGKEKSVLKPWVSRLAQREGLPSKP